ncbi:MAG: histidine phosphatase family protein [Caldilineaceae bacterium]|nr:histidine phosphatase family protein [Caldilineaceae bacterium]
MKTLSIIRHAKALAPEEATTDFDRPLTKRGQKDAAQLGHLLATLQPEVDWLISSPSLRTRETTDLLRRPLNYTKSIQWEESAYLAEAEQWLTLLKQAPPEAQHIAIVGHNPGLAELIAGLAAGAATHLNFALPTAAIAHLELEIFWWSQIRWGCGQLVFLLPPKLSRKLQES